MAIPERIYPEKMPLRQSPKREAKMRQMIKQLQAMPIVQIARERAGVSRPTYYRWRAIDTVFSRAADHAIESGRFLVNDMAESQLIRKIKEGDFQAIKYWLFHNHPRYSKNYIHDHCQVCGTKSIEEKHLEMRREMRSVEAVTKGISEMTKEIDDQRERKALDNEDWMLERFEMIDDDTVNDEKVVNQGVSRADNPKQ